MGHFSNLGYVRILEETVGSGIPIGVTYRPNTDQIFVSYSDPKLRIIDRHNNIEQDDVDISSASVINTRAIAYMGGSQFAVLIEDIPARIHTFRILPNQDFITDESDIVLSEIDVTTDSAPSGLAYDPILDAFYVITNNLAEDDGAVYKVTDYEGTGIDVRRLWFNYDKLVETGEVDSTAEVTGLAWGGGIGVNSLFILTTGATHRVIEVDINGNVLSSFGHGNLTRMEDLAFDSVYKDLFIVGNGFLFRYEQELPDPDIVPDDLVMTHVNHAGNDFLNPIVEGLNFRITLNKHDVADAIRHCWVTVGKTGGGVYLDLSDRVVTTDTSFYVDVVSGTDLKAGNPARLNVIHFTTTADEHHKVGIFVRTLPPNRIELDGYNADNFNRPLLIPLLGES